VEQLKYLGTNLTEQTSIYEKIKRRLKSRNACKSFVLQFAIQKHKAQDILNHNFPVVLYGCATWSFTLREERRLRVFEKRVPRRIFGANRDEVTGEWRKLHNEELHDEILFG
jgi:hypothetical protein